MDLVRSGLAQALQRQPISQIPTAYFAGGFGDEHRLLLLWNYAEPVKKHQNLRDVHRHAAEKV